MVVSMRDVTIRIHQVALLHGALCRIDDRLRWIRGGRGARRTCGGGLIDLRLSAGLALSLGLGQARRHIVRVARDLLGFESGDAGFELGVAGEQSLVASWVHVVTVM